MGENMGVGIDKILLEMVAINPDIILPFFGQFFFGKYGCHGTNGLACAAINTLIRIYVELHRICISLLILPWVNAIYRANINAGGVLNIDAGFGNYIGHRISSAFPAILDRRKDVCKWVQSEVGLNLRWNSDVVQRLMTIEFVIWPLQAFGN
jgi:hypothetical protein